MFIIIIQKCKFFDTLWLELLTSNGQKKRRKWQKFQFKYIFKSFIKKMDFMTVKLALCESEQYLRLYYAYISKDYA